MRERTISKSLLERVGPSFRRSQNIADMPAKHKIKSGELCKQSNSSNFSEIKNIHSSNLVFLVKVAGSKKTKQPHVRKNRMSQLLHRKIDHSPSGNRVGSAIRNSPRKIIGKAEEGVSTSMEQRTMESVLITGVIEWNKEIIG